MLLDEISLADDSVLERLNRSVDIPLMVGFWEHPDSQVLPILLIYVADNSVLELLNKSVWACDHRLGKRWGMDTPSL